MQTSLPSVNSWSVMQKLLFRFFAVYFFIYIFPFPVRYIPFADTFSTWYNHFWDLLVPWAGKTILHVNYPITVKPNGSGDTTYNYVQLFLFATFAIIGAIIWSVADRKRKSYDLLLYWLTEILNFYSIYFSPVYI